MANHIQHLLNEWFDQKDQTEWVAGFVYQTEGPCYRKAGAVMLFGGEGQQLGLLSGGCLESDLQRHARKVMQTGKSVQLTYDANDEDDVSFQLGIGCGGTVHIVLMLINQANQYLDLHQVHAALQQRQCSKYQLHIDQAHSTFELVDHAQATVFEDRQLTFFAEAVPHLLVVGGGIDARPVVSLARDLGWQVSLCDPRPANARAEHFQGVDHTLRDLEQLPRFCDSHKVNAAIVMSHNISMDAEAIRQLASSQLGYVALLGPNHRKQQVMEAANLLGTGFADAVYGPAGLDIGGELPESIALSMLAQCHQQLFKPAR